MSHRNVSALVGLLVLGAAACGTGAGAEPIPTSPPADVAACPVDDPDCYETGAEDPATGMCAPDITDCVDVDVDAVDPLGAACPVGDPNCYETGAEGDTCRPDADECVAGNGDLVAVDQASALLGVSEDQLAPDVRVARRGAEVFALTEDYVIGRITVEVDDVDGTGFRVVTATVELPDGMVSFGADTE